MPFVILKNPGGIVSVKGQEKKKKYIYIYTYIFLMIKIVYLRSNYFIFISRLTPLYRIPIKKNIKLYITTELGKWIF